MRGTRPRPRAVSLVCALALAACSEDGDPRAGGRTTPAGGAESSTAATPSTSAIPSGVASASASASPAAANAEPPLPGSTEGCPDDMVRVSGDYCPAVMQDCVEHHKEYAADKDRRKTVSERCLRYRSPSRCVSKKRRAMSFCVDRFEYPNQRGAIPRVLSSWHSAKALCEAAGKRLCSEDEFNFACEGPDMLPYTYGFTRDPEVCPIDKPYRYPDHSKVMLEYDACLTDEWCKAELDRLDQREPSGSRPGCVSWAGVFDLNGNVNEWVEIPKQKPPNRSGLKGGWWGPVRGRCRPTVTFHKESDYGYEAGFRCCKDSP